MSAPIRNIFLNPPRRFPRDGTVSVLAQGFTFPAAAGHPRRHAPNRADTPTPSSHGEEEESAGHGGIFWPLGPLYRPRRFCWFAPNFGPLREKWIAGGDTAQLDGPSSEYGRARERDAKLASLRFRTFENRVALKPGASVSRCTTRLGLVTPEMEYIAIRETLRLNELRNPSAPLLRQHRLPELRCGDSEITPSSCAPKLRRRARHHSIVSTTRSPSR